MPTILRRQGRQFDDSGNVKVWWQKDTADRYLEKADCIVEQYGNFTDQRTLLKVRSLIFVFKLSAKNFVFIDQWS